MRRTTHRKRRWIFIVITLIVVAGLAFAGARYYQITQSASSADRVLNTMKKVVPGLGVDTGESAGIGRDPLVAMEIDDTDIVGCLEVPSLDMMVPVTDKKKEKTGFVTWLDGSPVQGQFRLIGDRLDVFQKLTKTRPGDRVAFTDMDGVRYEYEVTTQLHLKNWDEGKYDLMLCYDVDDQTRFVVGCTKGL